MREGLELTPLYSHPLSNLNDMPIPEAQLVTWSNIGAGTTLKDTHISIRTALGSSPVLGPLLSSKKVEVFLQGSYANDTNVRGSSDVDVVVMLTTAFVPDLTQLTSYEAQRYQAVHSAAEYGWPSFYSDVLSALQSYYNASHIEEGNKAIKVKPYGGRLPADVIPCLEFRRYCHFNSLTDHSYDNGVHFFGRKTGERVINYPKLHLSNGAAKNHQDITGGRFKCTVRMFKNARDYMMDQHMIAKGIAPSYFLECLLHNVPNEHFENSKQLTFGNILQWLASNIQTGVFMSQNGLIPLFSDAGQKTDQQWSRKDAIELMLGYCRLWERQW